METSNKLNLGCWVFKREGWINIDIDPQYADVVADVNDLPYEDNSVDEIYAGHVLEHCKDTDVALKEWLRVLKPGARIDIVVPDTAKALQIPVHTPSFGNVTRQRMLDMVVFGSDDRKEQNHYHVFTEDLLHEFMSKYFRELRVVETDIPFQTYITAVK